MGFLSDIFADTIEEKIEKWREILVAVLPEILAEDDDFCEPTFLEKMLPYFNDPDVKLAYCQSNAVDDDDNILFSYHAYTSEFDPHRWNA